MSMNLAEISCISRALGEAEGGFLQKIRQTSPGRLFLEIRKPGKSFRIFCCAESGRTRICLSDSREESPVPPLHFQSLLRSRIQGAELLSLRHAGDDRTVRMDFQTEGGTLSLIAELLGRRGNIFLVSKEGKIIGSAMPSASHSRELKPGGIYHPPSSENFVRMAEDPPRFSENMSLQDMSRFIEDIYRKAEARETALREISARTSPLKARLRKALRALEAARGDLARTDEAENFRRRGELLKANLYRVRRGDARIQVAEYAEDGIRQTELRLNPALSPQEQVEDFFRKYRRMLAGKDKASARVSFLQEEVRRLQASLEEIQNGGQAQTGAGTSEGTQTASHAPVPPQAGQAGTATSRSGRGLQKGKKVPFREYVSSSGQRIWVGRNAALNDSLTFGCARGNDMWIHARNVPGSHVVIPLERREEVKDETLLDALELARHFSGHKGDAGEVSWTRVKYVRRQKDGPPGAVIYSQEKTAMVRPDKARLDRLLLSAEGG